MTLRRTKAKVRAGRRLADINRDLEARRRPARALAAAPQFSHAVRGPIDASDRQPKLNRQRHPQASFAASAPKNARPGVKGAYR
jgi:hypothetical protein